MVAERRLSLRVSTSLQPVYVQEPLCASFWGGCLKVKETSDAMIAA